MKARFYISVFAVFLFAVDLKAQSISAITPSNTGIQIDMATIFYAFNVPNVTGSYLIVADKTETFFTLKTLSEIKELGCNKFYLITLAKPIAEFAINREILINASRATVRNTPTNLAVISTQYRNYSFYANQSYTEVINQTNTNCATGGTADLTYNQSTRTIENTGGTDAIIPLATTVLDGLFGAVDKRDLNKLLALSGVPYNATTLGLFAGITIPDNTNNKDALQALETAVESKQDALVSGSNIKTVNGNSLLGSGNLVVTEITVATTLPQQPTPNQLWYDKANKVMYQYKNGDAWYYQGILNRYTTPTDTSYIVSGTIVTIKYTDAEWYNTQTKSYWDYDYADGVWRNRQQWTIDDLLGRNNTWTGTNTWTAKGSFKDSLYADKGLQANGLVSAKAGVTSDSTITSKGVNTEGATNKAAAQFRGVLSMSDTTVTSNYSANGRHGKITGDCSSNNIVLTLPAPTSDNFGWCYELDKKQNSSFTFRVTQGSFSHVIFSPYRVVRVRQKGGFWDLD